MDLPFEYDHAEPLVFGGALPHRRSFDDSAVVILPVPVDRTTSYVGGTRNGPHEILQASSHMELWDEEMRADVHGVGIFTLPEMELPFGEMEAVLDEIERVAYEIVGRDKFLVSLGGEHSITPPLVSAAARKYPGMSVLQIDAHADMRDSYMGTKHNHACAMRRSLHHARLTQVGIRSLSTEEADILPKVNTTVFYDVSMRRTRTGSTRWSPRSPPTSTSPSTWTAWTRRSCRPRGRRSRAACRGPKSPGFSAPSPSAAGSSPPISWSSARSRGWWPPARRRRS